MRARRWQRRRLVDWGGWWWFFWTMDWEFFFFFNKIYRVEASEQVDVFIHCEKYSNGSKKNIADPGKKFATFFWLKLNAMFSLYMNWYYAYPVYGFFFLSSSGLKQYISLHCLVVFFLLIVSILSAAGCSMLEWTWFKNRRNGTLSFVSMSHDRNDIFWHFFLLWTI